MSRWKHGLMWMMPLAILFGLLSGGADAATFTLEYRTDGKTAGFSLPLGESEVRFKKEPSYAGKDVVRSVLYVSPERKEFIGFACDSEGSTLYLDLNRNLDLTDDPEGVISSTSEGWGHFFASCSIPIEQEGRRREMLVDLTIYGDQWGRYEVKSSWESESVSIDDQTFRVSIVDDGDGVITAQDILYLEPIEEFQEEGAEGISVELKAPTTLVLNGVPVALTYALSSDGKTLALSVEPSSAPLVEVEMKGNGVERIVMQDEALAAVYLGPSTILQIPPGNYNGDVWVRMGEGKASSLWNAGNVSLHVRGGSGRESWLVGGPIVSKLTCSIPGNRLQFDQKTVGVGDEKYTPDVISGGSISQPKLRIKKAGEVIHVGEFEYG